MEGPLFQGVYRGIPSKTKGSSDRESLLEVWSGAVMFQVITIQFWLFFVYFNCCFSEGDLPVAAGYVMRSANNT